MSAVLLPNGKQQYTTVTGAPLVGGKVFTYDTGTTTPRTTWADAAQVAPNANPVILDARGEAPIFWSGAYRVVIQDAIGNAVWTMDGISDLSYGAGLRADLASFTDGAKGAGLVGYSATVSYGVNTVGSFLDSIYSRNAAEVAAAVVPVNLFYPPYIRGRYANFTDWRLASDQAGAEGSLDADYAITADTYLPKKCDFRGFKITGLFKTIHAYHGSIVNPGQGWVKGWKAARPCIFGTYYGKYDVSTLVDNLADVLTVMGGDGVSANTGCFWNDIEIGIVGYTLINCDRFDVNFNTFRNGISRGVRITGGAGGLGQAHANTFFMVDMSDSSGGSHGVDAGYLQDDSARSKNFLVGLYYENGSQIRGNVDIKNYQGDSSQGIPLTDRFNHIMGTVGLNTRVSRDFLSLTVHNAVRGGNWDWTDTNGKPPGINNSGGAGPAVIVDTTEPCGIGKRYEASFAAAFSGFALVIQPNGTDRFGVDLFYKSTADFFAVESNDGTGTTSYGTTAVVVDAANNWKLLRIAGPASKTATTGLSLLAYGAVGGAAKVMALGGVFGGGELAVIGPQKNQDFESGLYTPTLTNGTNVAASTAYPMQYSRVGNTVTVCGRVDIDPTLAAPTASDLGISLPIVPSTAFSLAQQCMGCGVSEVFNQVGLFYADPANNRAQFRFRATNVANDSYGVTFSYRMS